MTTTLDAGAFMAFTDVPPGSQNYRKGIVRNAPEHYTATIQTPVKVSGSWYYGVHVSRDIASPRGSVTSSQKSLKSLSLNKASSGFFIRRKWEDCLDLQKILETEMASMRLARKRSDSKSSRDKRSSTRLYPSERAASFESLPCGDSTAFLDSAVEGVPKLSRKASLFKASQAIIQKRHVEFAALVGWLFGVEYALAEDLRHCTSVREWFSYWRSDKEMEGKVRVPTAPAAVTPVTLPPTLGMRGRQESVSSMTTMSTATSSEMSSVPGLSPEIRVSGASFLRPATFISMQDRPLSMVTDMSEDYFDELDKTIDTFPAPPPLKDEAVRALSPSLRKRAASSEQLSRLGLMSPVPETSPSAQPYAELPSPPQSPRGGEQSHSPPLRATLPAKPRHWQSMLNLRDASSRSLSSLDMSSVRVSPLSPTLSSTRPQARDQRALSTHARSNSKYRNALFLSAPNTPNLGGENDAGFVYPPAVVGSSGGVSPSVPWTAGSDSSFFNSSPLGSTPDLDRRHRLSALTRTDSSHSSRSSENVPRLPYAASNGSLSNSGLTQDMHSSVSTLSTDMSEPAEDERASALTTPLPPAVPPLPAGLTRSRAVPDGLVSRLMMGSSSARGQDGFSRPSSGEQDLIDDYLYSTIEESLSEATRSLAAFTESFEAHDKKYGESWISMDLDEETMPILLEKDLPPSPQLTEEDAQSAWSSPRKQSVHSFVSSPDQFPKSFQHRPAGQFHLPWSSPPTSTTAASTPPKTPPGDSLPDVLATAPPVPNLVVKAHHPGSGSIVSFRVPRVVSLVELRERLEQKFLDSEDLVLGSWRLAYSPNQLNKLPSRRNLSTLTSISSPGSVASGRTRSDSGMSISAPDVESLVFIHSNEEFTSALSACGAGKLTLHIIE